LAYPSYDHIGFVQKYFTNAFDGDGEGYDSVVAGRGGAAVEAGGALGGAVAAAGAQRAEDGVAGLAEEQLLPDVHGALGDNLAALPGHEVQELVDEERGRQGRHAAAGDGDELAADGAAEGALLRGAAVRRGDAAQAVQAHRVRARQQLRGVLATVVHACGGTQPGTKLRFRTVIF